MKIRVLVIWIERVTYQVYRICCTESSAYSPSLRASSIATPAKSGKSRLRNFKGFSAFVRFCCSSSASNFFPPWREYRLTVKDEAGHGRLRTAPEVYSPSCHDDLPDSSFRFASRLGMELWCCSWCHQAISLAPFLVKDIINKPDDAPAGVNRLDSGTQRFVFTPIWFGKVTTSAVAYCVYEGPWNRKYAEHWPHFTPFQDDYYGINGKDIPVK
ncbi:hypothetical protein ASPCAL10355 [Aspergillus calidoustus]|uniref:Uncharacterized protein n=1 Tax=Aspergillus calidoustus TaxID=454130 RepID=A0A0U5G9W8_ASPCI|nr:hypothetical protein ASPCAL10355 [Aspergillus calidoustus]